jgi:predicted ribosomally synthesized peptide with nif11-like leader
MGGAWTRKWFRVLTGLRRWAKDEDLSRIHEMSEEQLSALLAKLNDDTGLLEKLKGAADLDAAESIAKEAGFDVSKEEWLRHQAKQVLGLSDAELEGVAGGKVLVLLV